MTFLRCVSAGLPLVAVSLVYACSSSSPAIPQVYVTATVDVGLHAGNQCGVEGSDTEWVTIGSPTASLADGSTQTGGQVSVDCTVKANGDGTFNVVANASVTGDSGGSLFVSAPKWTAAPNTVTNVSATFQRGDVGTFKESDCTVSYSGSQGVAAGRVWGTLSCPNIVNMATMAAGGFETCAGTAQFKFENCAD